MRPTSSAPVALAIVVFFTGRIFCWANGGPEKELPRYKFEVCQELVYAGSSEFKYENGTHLTTSRTTLWVTRKNDDGSWHLIACSENTFTQRAGSDANATPHTSKRIAVGEFDVGADGTPVNLPEGHDGPALMATFFKLPVLPQEVKSGWKVEADGGTESYLYRVLENGSASGGNWMLERSDAGIFSKIYVLKNRNVIRFDAGRGIVTRIESESSQGYGFHGKGTGTVELQSSEMKDPKWIEQLVRETGLLLNAQKAIRNEIRSSRETTNSENVNTSEEALRAGRKEVRLPLVVALFEEQQKQIDDFKKYRKPANERNELVLNKAAADWSTTDIDGEKHALNDYLGKVVVLDFWYRGCGWCVKAMPQIKEVVNHFQDRPVAILGMNTDRDDKDARFVVDTLGLNYPTLKGQGLPEKYGVRGFPTLVVIDRKGTVRKLHVGYSPTLRQELIDTIEGLLKDQE